MKKVLLPIVTAALLVCGPAAAAISLPDPCGAGGRHAAAAQLPTGAARVADGCGRIVKSQLGGPFQKSLSDKEIEQALKRQGFRGRLVEMIPNERGINEVKVLWETREGGKRTYRTLIVDAKTGKFKREERR